MTLSLERGLRPEVVMKVTGHRDWKSFKRYVNITEQTVEKELRGRMRRMGPEKVS